MPDLVMKNLGNADNFFVVSSFSCCKQVKTLYFTSKVESDQHKI